jgi:hypothetical protein
MYRVNGDMLVLSIRRTPEWAHLPVHSLTRAGEDRRFAQRPEEMSMQISTGFRDSRSECSFALIICLVKVKQFAVVVQFEACYSWADHRWLSNPLLDEIPAVPEESYCHYPGKD